MLKLLLIIILCVNIAKQNSPEVKIDQGILKGSYRKTWNGRIFNSFTGIPYAKPPVGKLRFKAPEPAESWDGVLDATEGGSVCTQHDIFTNNLTVIGSEDCLFLNVYSPKLKTSNDTHLFPVMFYIHGGGWITGSSDLYGPKILLDKDVVLVTLNYRLGAFGFLSTGDRVAPGNNGLKDQSLALKWVQRNIVYFSGNPDSVTVFGQSAGGASSHYHMLSPLSKNLFHRVILQSGCALGPWAFASKSMAVNNTQNLAKYLNCPYTTSEEMINCLRNVSAYDIITQDSKLWEWSYFPLVTFRPTIEEEVDGAFLTDTPINIIKYNKAAKVPLMIGLTTEDGAFNTVHTYNSSQLLKNVNHDFNKVAPLLLMYPPNVSDYDTISEKLKMFYFGDTKIDAAAVTNFSNMITDSWFLLPLDETIRLHATYTEAEIYYYIFGYQGGESFTSFFRNPNNNHDYGVCHGDELNYLFSFTYFKKYIPNQNDLKMIKMMSTLWTNYASTGNPTPTEDEIIPTKWEPVTTDKFEHYFIKNANEVYMEDSLNLKERIKPMKEVSTYFGWQNVKDEL